MVICQYFIKGTCRFGDRCFNEHRKSDNKSFNSQRYGGGRQGGNDGYRGSNDGYRGGNDGYHGGNDSYRGGNDGYRGGNDGYRGGNDGYHGGNDGYRGGNDGYHGGKDSYHGGNDGYHGGNDSYRGGGKNFNKNKYQYDSRNTGSNNRFSALSHQPDPEMANFDQRSQPRARADSSSQQHSVTSEQRLDRVTKDIKEWNEGGQWPLSCYVAFVHDSCFEGLVDISPEEVRVEAYKANVEGNAQNYAHSLQQTMEKYAHRKRELASLSLSSLQHEKSKSSQPNNPTSGLFGSVASSPSPFGGNQTSLFGNSQPATTTSSELFGSGSQSSPGTGPFGSSPFAPSSKQVTFVSSTLPATNSAAGPFGSSSGSTLSSQSLFGTLENNPSITENTSEAQTSSMASDTRPQAVVPLLKCSEQDMKAFKADHFVLGAIPECPPPPELC